ncbi:CPBP family intramembrane glutamic endopeptidase [Rossellomorea aquimaris]|uniref:CPBP family intramembrane glutamic endopeptidase n=1 Tax=Rossellomorea aquimaris TaxID=189382 RepID=UPI0007D04EE4|nr:CPBP family intramembrane glutamic endopeptidase [Rossellomorea aquimaris]
MAIILTSILFSIMYISTGSPAIVFIDLSTIFIDSLLFGVIFYKTNNLYVSWIAHALGNLNGCLMHDLFSIK